MSGIRLEAYALTHEGNVRGNNEDNFYLFGTYKKDVNEKRMTYSASIGDEDAIAAVYDGMGGEEAGEVASLMAARKSAAYPMEEVRKRSEELIISVNDEVCEKIRERGSRMGTTAVQLYFGSGKACCVNIGDSRGYLFRNGQLKQLSVDHSEGQRMIDMGISTPEEARKSKNWHTLTQHIGIFPEEFVIEPYVSEQIVLQDRDIFLLCSDGLTDMLSNVQISSILEKNENRGLKETAEDLLQAALANGGKDNTTIVLVKAHTGNNAAVKKQNAGDRKPAVYIGIGFVIGAVFTLILCIMVLWFGGFSGSEKSTNETEVISTELEGDEASDVIPEPAE